MNDERAVWCSSLCQCEGFGGRYSGPGRPVNFKHLNLNTLKDEKREGCCFVKKGDIVHLIGMGVFEMATTQMLMFDVMGS